MKRYILSRRQQRPGIANKAKFKYQIIDPDTAEIIADREMDDHTFIGCLIQIGSKPNLHSEAEIRIPYWITEFDDLRNISAFHYSGLAVLESEGKEGLPDAQHHLSYYWTSEGHRHPYVVFDLNDIPVEFRPELEPSIAMENPSDLPEAAKIANDGYLAMQKRFQVLDHPDRPGSNNRSYNEGFKAGRLYERSLIDQPKPEDIEYKGYIIKPGPDNDLGWFDVWYGNDHLRCCYGIDKAYEWIDRKVAAIADIEMMDQLGG